MTEEKICPACGKPTAGYVPCPHCGVDPSVRTGMKAIAIICVIALGLGSVFLIMHLATIEAQPTLISSIDSWQDYAYVWVSGTVISGPNVSTTALAFNIQDASGGSLRVEVYDPAYKNLIANNMVPKVGDDVTVFGQLRVFIDGSTELRVSKAGDITITKAQPIVTSIREILNSWSTTQELKYKRVTLEGMITKVRPLSSAKIYTLEDNLGNTLEMYVHNGLMYLGGRPLDIRALQVVRVTAGASEYSRTPQLALAGYDDIKVIGTQSPIQVSLDNIDNTLVNKFVRVRGKIIFVEMVGESSSLAVGERRIWLDNQYNPHILLGEDIYKLLPDNMRKQLKRGATAELTGRVSRYRATLMINIFDPSWLSLQSDTYEPPLVENVATIGSDDLDNLVKVEGRIVGGTSVFRGLLPSDREFILQDAFGENIKLWVTNTIYERMPYPLAVGDNVRVVGKVMQRGGSIAVQPGVPSDIEKVS